MIEAMVLGVPFIAALVYLVVEICEFNVWWRRKRTPPSPPVRPRSLGDTWPDHRRKEAEDEWERMLEERKDA